MTDLGAIRAELAPTGVLRAGINLGNPLLVTGETADGDPVGVAADMTAEIARRLEVPITYVTYPSPGALGDAAGEDAWDVGLIGAEPQRAEKIDFTDPYVLIEATYLVPAGSTLNEIADVDQPGVRIAISARSAFDLYLSRNLEHAELVRAQGLKGSLELFRNEGLDALAGLRPGLLQNVEDMPGARVLDGRFTTVNQAIGTPKGRPQAAAWLQAYVTEALEGGLVAGLIDRHGVTGKLLPATD